MMNRIFSRVTLNKKVLSYNFCTDIRPSDGYHDRLTIEVIQSKAMLQASLPRNQPVTIPLRNYNNVYTFKRHQLFCHTPATVYAAQNFLWDRNHSIISRINLNNHSYNSIRHFSLHELFSQPNDINVAGTYQRSFIMEYISTTFPVEIMQDLMVKLHDWSGLPWWTTILLATIFVRIISLSTAVHEQIIIARIKNASIELMEKMHDISVDSYVLAQKHMWTINNIKNYRKKTADEQWSHLVKKHNCQPQKLIVLKLISMSGSIILSVTLGNLIYMYPELNYNALMINQQLSQEGFGWIKNFLQTDPYCIVSLTWFTTSLMNLWLYPKLNPVPMKMSKVTKYIYPGFCCIFLPLSVFIPSAFMYMWTVNNILHTGQIFLVTYPPFRKFIGIPECKSEPTNSHLLLHKTIKSK